MSMHIIFNNQNFLRVMSSQMTTIVEKAISQSLNNVAFDAMRLVKQHVSTDLHNTKPFLKQSIVVQASTPATKKAEVGVLSRVYFANLLIKGGERHSNRSKYVAVPVGAKGSNGRAKRSMDPRKILAKRNYFVRVLHGKKGIWYCTRRMLYPKLMYVLVLRTEYDQAPYLNWEHIVNTAVITSNFEQKFFDNLQRVLNRTP